MQLQFVHQKEKLRDNESSGFALFKTQLLGVCVCALEYYVTVDNKIEKKFAVKVLRLS
jgi:hypothetical protein